MVKFPQESQLADFPVNEVSVLRDDLGQIDFDIVQTHKFTSASKMDLKSTEYFERDLIQELNYKTSDVFVDFFVRIYG